MTCWNAWLMWLSERSVNTTEYSSRPSGSMSGRRAGIGGCLLPPLRSAGFACQSNPRCGDKLRQGSRCSRAASRIQTGARRNRGRAADPRRGIPMFKTVRFAALAAAASLMAAPALAADSPVVGTWATAVDVQGMKIEAELTVAQEGSGYTVAIKDGPMPGAPADAPPPP